MVYMDQKREGNTIVDTYVLGISIKKDEYLRVIYLVEEHLDWMGAFGEDVIEIKEVEIVGDSNLVIQLFVLYWKTKIYKEMPVNGYITSKEVMSNYVVLSAVALNQYKITITKGNREMNDAKTFGLHQKINTTQNLDSSCVLPNPHNSSTYCLQSKCILCLGVSL